MKIADGIASTGGEGRVISLAHSEHRHDFVFLPPAVSDYP